MVRPHVSASAMAVAEHLRRVREQAEEEVETAVLGYGPEWEFKILRANLGSFGKPGFLEAVLAEEAKNGWRLVEKFDDARLRLARPVRMRNRKAAPGIDPYRVYVGPSQLMMALLIFIGIIVLLVLVIAIGLLFD